MMFKVLAMMLVTCLLVQAVLGDAAADSRKQRQENSRAPHEFLKPPPKGRNLSGEHSTGDSIKPRIARWFFAPEGSPERMPEIQDRKPTAPASGYEHPKATHGPTLSSYGPPRPHPGPPKPSNIQTAVLPQTRRGRHGSSAPSGQQPSATRVISYHAPPPPRYGPPKSVTGHGPPSNQYGPPKVPNNYRPPTSQYGPPKLQAHHGPPSNQYGPPKPSSHGTPSTSYGAPPILNPPSKPINSHGPPPGIIYGSPIRPPNHAGIPHKPSPISSVKGRNCNPCNKVPWIPLATGIGSSSAAGVYLPPAPTGGGSGVTQLKPVSGDYGPPLPASELAHTGSTVLQLSSGGVRSHSNDEYGPPPPPPQPPKDHYGSPDLPTIQFKPPSAEIPNIHHGVPDNLSPPPLVNTNGLSSPDSIYGLPSSGNINSPPAPENNYGPPSLGDINGPPAPEINYGPPQLGNIGPSAPGNNYGPPPSGNINGPSAPGNNYGPPPSENINGPSVSGNNYGPPPSGNINGHSASGNNYGPPPSGNINGPSAQGNNFGPPPPGNDYGPPPNLPGSEVSKDEYGPPPPVQTSIPNTLYGSPSEPVLSPTFLLVPPIHDAQVFRKQPSDFLVPPQAVDSNSDYSGSYSHQHHAQEQVPYNNFGGGNIDVVKSVTVLSETQSSNIITEEKNSAHLRPEANKWNQDQSGLPPNDQLHLPSGDYHKESFNSNTIPGNLKKQVVSTNDLEIVKSVQVADFVSSVEYPPEVVQSPYIDVNAQDSSHKVESVINGSQYQAISHSSDFHQGLQSQGEIIVGKPIINEVLDKDKEFNGHASNPNFAENFNIDSSHSDQEFQHSFEISPNPSKEHADSLYSSHNVSGGNEYENHKGIDQKQSSTNKDIINRPNDLDQSPPRDDLTYEGSNVYSGESQQQSIIRHEEHRTQLQNTGNFTSSHSQGQSHNFNGNAGGYRATQNSVIVDIQPSIQTSAQGASLIYQINGLNTPAPPFQQPFPNTPAQTSVFVSFQHSPPRPFNFPGQSIPPSSPFQNSFLQAPPPPTSHYRNIFPVETPVPYLNPPRESFKGFSAVTNPPIVDYSPWTPTVDSLSSTSTWGSATTSKPQVSHDTKNGVPFANVGLLPPPPPPPSEGVKNQQGKKTKQIQIIVPYLTSRDHIQFKFPSGDNGVLDTSGWSPINNQEPANNQGRNVPKPINCSDIISDGSPESQAQWQEHFLRCSGEIGVINTPQRSESSDDYHQHQESRRVTAKTPLTEEQNIIRNNDKKPHSDFREVQHIFASNIRDLLRGEEEPKPTAESVNLLNLQKNIDKWTALEFSMKKNNGLIFSSKDDSRSTTAKTSVGATLQHLLVPSKKIPDEYLTTTPLTFDDYTQEENFLSTPAPTIKQRNIIGNTGSVFYDHDTSGSNTHSVTATTSERPVNESHYSNSWRFFESNLVIPEAVTISTTTPNPPTTTEEPTEETTEDTTEVTDPTAPVSWDHLEVSISPITKEKVYVVTPLPSWYTGPTTASPLHRYTSSGSYEAISRPSVFVTTTTTPSPTSKSINDIIPFRNSFHSPAEVKGATPLTFHSPRFLIRPTPLPSLQRLFTVRASDVMTSTGRHADSTTEENDIEDDTYPFIFREREDYSATTPTPVNSTLARSGDSTIFELTDLPTYTPPDGAKVHTFSGHSKVITVVTPPTVVSSKKRFDSSTTTTTEAPEVVSRVRRLRPDRESYLWNFPELISQGDMLREEDVAAVRGAVLELKKERRS